MKARYTRGVIASSLIFLATAFSDLESLAQQTQSSHAADFWRQQQNAMNFKAFQDAKHGNYNAAVRSTEAALGSAVVADMWQRNAADEQEKVQKQYQEQLDQIQRNQEQILRRGEGQLENRFDPTLPSTPVQETKISAPTISEYELIRTKLNERNGVYSNLAKTLYNNSNPESLLEISSKMQNLLPVDKEYVETKLNSPSITPNTRKLLEGYKRLLASYEKTALANQGLGNLLMKRKENPEIWLTADATPRMQEATDLFNTLEQEGELNFRTAQSRAEILDRCKRNRAIIDQVNAKLEETGKFIELGKDAKNLSQFGQQVLVTYSSFTNVVAVEIKYLNHKERIIKNIQEKIAAQKQ